MASRMNRNKVANDSAEFGQRHGAESPEAAEASVSRRRIQAVYSGAVPAGVSGVYSVAPSN